MLRKLVSEEVDFTDSLPRPRHSMPVRLRNPYPLASSGTRSIGSPRSLLVHPANISCARRLVFSGKAQRNFISAKKTPPETRIWADLLQPRLPPHNKAKSVSPVAKIASGHSTQHLDVFSVFLFPADVATCCKIEYKVPSRSQTPATKCIWSSRLKSAESNCR